MNLYSSCDLKYAYIIVANPVTITCDERDFIHLDKNSSNSL